MNSPTEFQKQYPLWVTRKFWKKILSRAIWFGVLALGAAIPTWLVLFTPNDGSRLSLGYFILCAFFAFIVFEFLYAWYVKAYIKRYYYNAGDAFLSIQKGVFAPTEIHVQYAKIQDVYVDQDILDRIMGLYDVHIASATATSGIEAHIDGVDATVAENLKNLLLASIRGAGTPQMPMQSSVPSQPTAPVKLDRVISSVEYPISLRWILSYFGTGTLRSIVIAFALIYYVRLSGVAGQYASFVLVFFLVLIIDTAWKLLWRHFFHFKFLPEYIMLKTGVVSRQEKHMPYKSIQNVVLQQGILDRLLGISNVVIENAAQEMVRVGKTTRMQNSNIIIPGQPLAKGQELLATLNGIVRSQGAPASMGL